MIEAIKGGGRHRKGNNVCPQCAEPVIIEKYFGNHPGCGHCKTSYRSMLGY